MSPETLWLFGVVNFIVWTLFWWMDWKTKRGLAVTVAKVASALEAKGIGGDSKLDQLIEIAKSIHTLSNSQRGEVLRALAMSLKVTALREPTQTHIDAAERAEKDVEHHDRMQAQDDARSQPDATG